ncbi:hypothetical protein F521_13215 [Enterococcus hirae 67-03-C5]|nr:hypothetical protein F521_13215 [Enterococcus hirae 67-03-C5]
MGRILYHVDHVYLILYVGILHRADDRHVSGKHEYEKIIDENDSQEIEKKITKTLLKNQDQIFQKYYLLKKKFNIKTLLK